MLHQYIYIPLVFISLFDSDRVRRVGVEEESPGGNGEFDLCWILSTLHTKLFDFCTALLCIDFFNYKILYLLFASSVL